MVSKALMVDTTRLYYPNYSNRRRSSDIHQSGVREWDSQSQREREQGIDSERIREKENRRERESERGDRRRTTLFEWKCWFKVYSNEIYVQYYSYLRVYSFRKYSVIKLQGLLSMVKYLALTWLKWWFISVPHIICYLTS